jgi:hypothetical protein
VSTVPAVERAATPRWLRWGRWSWLVGAAFYAAVLVWIGWDDLAPGAAGILWSWVLAAVALELGTLWLRALKWRWALGSGTHSTEAFFLSKAGGQVTPARLGELAPLLWERHRSAPKAAWIVVDRILEASATLAFGLAGALWVFGLDARLALFFGVAAVIALAGTGAFLMIPWDRWTNAAASRLPSVLQRSFPYLESGRRAALALGSKFPMLAVWTVLCTALDIAVSWAVYRALGADVSVVLLAVAQCAHALVTLVPFAPNATGIPYAAAAGVLHELGGVPLVALALAIPLRGLVSHGTFWPSFALGAWWSRHR